ncbi:FtsB family cell division protein [Natranaerofaba carboxydovora]|uniref:FtsB family cell division protein n=1 Tax=Natranaerofaba carboxydovora TaxID=2742683 RepID=UPI001F128F3F|nr:septum formation initiator family protein [Natranaerofaba carboxydovora]UMZ75282.1 Septum formation initiator [Natranaerofaba carboxydovora]
MTAKSKNNIKVKSSVFRAIILILTVYFVYLFYTQTVNHVDLISKKDEIEKDIKEIKSEIDELETKIYKLDDKEQVELLARERLRLIGSDEILINVREHMSEEGKSD